MNNYTSLFKIVFTFIFAFAIPSTRVFSQTDSNFRDFKNSVKFNVSNTLLYDNSYQFSYERMIKENQSLNIFTGYQELPLITVDFKDASFAKDSNRKGYSIGADYRFFLGSINKYKGPRGVYLAPFVSFFQFETDRNIVYTNPDSGVVSNTNLNSKLNLTNIGGELGYQFIFWDRLVVDCVLFGPSVTHYNYNLKLDGSIPGIEDNEIYQKVIEAIKNKFPEVENLSQEHDVQKKGVQSITAIGFRYNISIGYRF